MLERRETADLVGATLSSLTPEYRAALVAKYVEGRSVADMAERSGKGLKATESHLHRARLAFARVFELLARRRGGLGGTGGVGAMVLQMAKIAGARVLATGGSDDKCARCQSLGADAAVNYKTQDVAAAVEAFAADGVNVFWETLREPNFDTIVSYLAERGRIVLMAGRDARPPFPVGPFYVKGCTLVGFVMFKATPDEQRACAADINQWLASGKLQPQISEVMPLSDAAKAHQLQEANTLGKAGSVAGKIVLKP